MYFNLYIMWDVHLSIALFHKINDLIAHPIKYLEFQYIYKVFCDSEFQFQTFYIKI